MTSFVGRRQATAEVKRVLSASRLVTLTGVGGVGKSRLALHVGREVRRAFPDGVWLVELATLSDPALVEQTVAAALDLLDHSHRDPATVLVEFLADKRLLLILDNCEHLLDGCASLAGRLLTTAPQLSMLATSRQPLGIAGEHLWPVPPLALPPTNVGAQAPKGTYDGLALFEDRAAAVVAGFTLDKNNRLAVTRLCRRLDGLPLAIELAAVRLRVLSVEEMLVRIEDRFMLLTGGSRAALPRHQTLRAAVEWSFELCSKPERLLWARCSVFAGDFDEDAAEGVCADAGLTVGEVFEAISGLVDKSILTREERASGSRYRILETIRHYGRERLEQAGDTALLRRRHRDYYLDLAAQADADSGGPRQYEWAERLRAERANLFAALDYCLTVPGQEREGLRLAACLWFYWAACGSVRDGRYWLDRALATDPAPSRERARALWTNGWIACLQGDIQAGLALVEEGRNLTQKLGDETGLTYAIQILGWAKMMSGDLPQAMSLFDHALARHRTSNRWTAQALIIFPMQVFTAGLSGDSGRAMTVLDESRAVCARQGDRLAMSWTLCCVGNWWAAGDRPQAAAYLRDSLRVKRDWNDQLGYPFCVDPLSWVAAAEGDWTRAAVLQGAADKMWGPIGTPLWGFASLIAQGKQCRARAREALGERAYQTAIQQGAQMSPEAVLAYALGEKPSTRATDPAGPPAATSVLTNREREVATLIAQGLTNKEIAARLVIAQRTAEGHVERILTKLGLTSRTQVATWLTRNDSRRT
ncbi:non-specific serine/threonine protein kinase [Kibdelosporangium banguiense]|uniref:Non-specific serine/threonine protein kinase n=1 Tax=Kibdelosporangium banguiense TaxID=1365924 RepID=A0ABS4TGJ2_9PSEU|nr:LuxR C-terminal-related transcriptional regulator [Kibdelosporangium banguiense]MBP2323530.1 non-specific serine/threonine protein kinase [Kibdelosporangium banguiense]